MKPQSNVENLLAKIAGDPSAETVTPKNMKEYYLKEIAENGSGSGGDGGVFVVNETLGELDKTYAEIAAAYEANQIVMLKSLYNNTPCASYLISFVHNDIAGKYIVHFSHALTDYDDFYAADTENGTLTPFNGE